MFTRFGRFVSRKVASKTQIKAPSEPSSNVSLQPTFNPLSKVDINTKGPIKYIYSDIESHLATFAICYNLGSKNEKFSNRGATHFMSHYLFGINSKMDAVAAVRPLIGAGANLRILNDRDNFSIVGHCSSDQIEIVFRRIYDALTKRLYRFDEFKYAMDSCLIDYDNICENLPHTYLLDKLHKYAFNNGIGNSLFADPLNIKKLDYDNVDWLFHSFKYTPCAISVAGYESELPKFFENLYRETNDSSYLDLPMSLLGCKKPEEFHSGDVRIQIDRRTTYVAVTFNGSEKYGKDYWKFLILQKYLVNSASKEYCTFSSSVINGALKKKIEEEKLCRVEGFNFSYLDKGMFGILLSSFHESVNEATHVVFDCLKKVSSSPLDSAKFEYAKKAAKFEFMSNFENKEVYLVDMAKQALFTDSYVPPETLATGFDSVNAADFEKFAHKVLSERPLLGVIGDPDYVDSLDKLCQ